MGACYDVVWNHVIESKVRRTYARNWRTEAQAEALDLLRRGVHRVAPWSQSRRARATKSSKETAF
jgi:hypothetical protein